MVAQPWKFFAQVDPNRDYIAVSTFLALESSRMRRAFQRDVKRVEGQLASSAGLVGFSLRVKFWRRHYWTLSIWEDEKSLAVFKETAPHRDVMAPPGLASRRIQIRSVAAPGGGDSTHMEGDLGPSRLPLGCVIEPPTSPPNAYIA